MLYFGMPEGSVKYTSYTAPSGFSFTNTATASDNFKIDGIFYKLNVGAMYTLKNMSDLRNKPLTFNFDYDIGNAYLYGLQSGTYYEFHSMVQLTNPRQVVFTYTRTDLTDKNMTFALVVEPSTATNYSLNLNLTNCTASIAGDTILETLDKEIILTCESGFVFDEIPTIAIGADVHSFSVSEDLRTATITVDITGDVVIHANARLNARVHITGTIENATCNYTDGEFIDNTKDIIISANDGYIFEDKTYVYEDAYLNTKQFENHRTYLTASTANATISLYLDSDYTAMVESDPDPEPEPDPEDGAQVFITGTIENATCNYTDGEFIDPTKDIIISANDGYIFEEEYYSYTDEYYNSFFFENHRTYLKASTANATLSVELDSNYVATKDPDTEPDPGTDPDPEQAGTFANLYKTNQTELAQLSKVRFYGSDGQVVDYGSYINSLYVLPFAIPSDIIGTRSNIVLGDLNSTVSSTVLTNYTFDVDAGRIEVPLKYDNIYDYVNTECVLHLPFLDKVFLSNEYVIGQTLTITFTVELYSGNLTANIVSSFTNEVVESVQGLIGMNIPFIQRSSTHAINSITNIFKNKTNRCFVEVNRNIPYTKDANVFGGDVVEYGKIGDYTGYLECDNLVLNTTATNQEQEEIKNVIRNGVFV